MKTARKLLTCLLIIGLLIGQNFTLALASSPSQLLAIQANSEPGSDKAQIVIKPLSDEINKLEVLLPAETGFDAVDNREANDGLSIEYDSSLHKATFSSEEPIGRVDVLISDIQQEQNTLTVSSWSHDVEREKIEYSFSVVRAADEESAEETPPETEANQELQPSAQEQADQSDVNDTEGKPQNNKESAGGETAEAPSAENGSPAINEKENQENPSARDDSESTEPETNEPEVKQEDRTSSGPSSGTEIQSTEPIADFTPFSGDLNIDLNLKAQKAEVLAGKDAAFLLTLKVTGSQTEYKNAVVTVNVPQESYMSFEQDLSELTIAGVTPRYDEANRTLVYEFDTLRSGQTYERYVKVHALNGYTPNNDEVSMEASFSADDVSTISATDSIVVRSSTSLALTKRFTEVRNASNNIVNPGSETVWEIKASIPKLAANQMYLKETGQIVITDTLPDGLTYVGMKSGPTPVRNGNQLTWTFDAPTLQEQEMATDSLFFTTLEVILRVKAGTANTTQVNQATIVAESLDNKTNSSRGQGSVSVVSSVPGDGTIEGTWYIPNHLGPADDAGTIAKVELKNPNPVVHDDALLGFSAGIAPLPESQYGDYRSYITHYMIDDNLNLSHLTTPGGFIYRPNANYPAGIPLKTQPVFQIQGMVNGQLRTLVSAEDVELGKTYTRAELGLSPSDRVSEIRYNFSVAPSGMLNSGVPRYYFTVDEGYRGEVRNRYNVTGTTGTGAAFDKNFHNGPLDTVYGPRTAQVTERPKPSPPVASISVEFLDHNSSQVIPGENRLKVTLSNESVSTSNMTSPLESVVLLPAGVKLSDTPNPGYTSELGGSYEILSEDYNGSGRQLVKISWNDTRLKIGSSLSAELDIVIADNAPSHLQVDAYGFSGDSRLSVPSNPGGTITGTILQTDTDDLNKNGVQDEPRLKSGNIYSIRTQYDVQTEKLVKGELDDTYSSFGHTTPGGRIDYLLKLTNTTGDSIRSMTLIDVLPSVGDLGITDNIDRGSQFTPALSGPITLPTEWQNKVNVFYSTATNPVRDDLTKNTEYPESTTPLSNPDGAETPNWTVAGDVTDWSSIHSFKIELKDGTEWIEGVDMTILFSMTAPSEAEVPRGVLNPETDPASRAAWNSFALATNHGQPVEPERVGVYMDYDIENPVVDKTVNGQTDPYELTNRDEHFTWEIDYAFGNYTHDWESVSLSDQIHELLDVVDVKVLDQDGNDVSGTGTLTTENNLVTFLPGKQNDSFGYLANQTYTLVIESKIKESATVEELLPFTQGNGIPNQAELIVNDVPNPSNEVTVKPPGYGHLQVVKVDAANSSLVLEGAEFELQQCVKEENGDAICTTVSTGTTASDGTLRFTDLPLGDYRLVETKAPEGYTLLTAPINLQISEAGETVELTVKNTPAGWELPETGGIGTAFFYGGGAVLMALAGFMLIRRRENRD